MREPEGDKISQQILMGVTVLNTAEIRNQKIIDAVLKKEKALYPGAIALIGIYGSFQTGNIHPLSDLDLLILINDERAWQLGTAFILEDPGIGYDIYCTDWESLRRDAAYEDPNIAKLMDARIVYCADEKYRSELEALRGQVRQKQAEPFSETDYLKAESLLKNALHCFALAMIGDDLSEVRKQVGGVLYFAENAVAMLNKCYFRKGFRRRFEELNAMTKRPERLCEMIEDILAAGTVPVLKERLTILVKELTTCFERERQTVRPEKKPASEESLRGTYEEMFSNWHGKMQTAAESGNRHLAFMSLVSLDEMLSDIRSGVDISPLNAVSVYDPEDLGKTASGFDDVLRAYLQEYNRAGMKAAVYQDIDAFLAAYLKQEDNSLEIRTKRLTVRPVRIGDEKEIHEYASDKDITMMFWLPNDTIEETVDFVKKNAQEWSSVDQTDFEFVILLDGRIIGGCDCDLSHSEDRSYATLGWIINKEFRNQGYASEAASAMLDFAFNNLRIDKVYAQCDTNNPASFGVMRKIGMKCINDKGTRTYPRTGITSGEYTCLITRREWELKRERGNH